MNSYDTLVEALQDLKKRGFTHDFNLEKDRIYCTNLKMYYRPKEFNVLEFYRFEGMSNPDDNAILYAVETSTGDKGVLVDAYGVYESVSPEMINKLKIHH